MPFRSIKYIIANLDGDAIVATSTSGYSETGYVNTNSGNVTFNVTADIDGYYDLYFRYFITSQKVNTLYVDGQYATDMTFGVTTAWTEIHVAMLKLYVGSHTNALKKVGLHTARPCPNCHKYNGTCCL